MQALEEAQRINPAPTEAFFDLALVQQSLGRYGDAEESFRRFLAVYPEDFQANFLLGVTLSRQGKTQEALTRLLRAESLDSGDPQLALELGNLFLDLGDLEEAEKRFQKSEDPTAGFANLGIVAKQKGRLDEAERYFREALDKNPGDHLLWGHLGDVLMAKEKWLAATEAYRQAIALEPNDFNSLINLGTLDARADRLDEAMSRLQRAVELRPDSGLAHINLALVLERVGKAGTAKGHYVAAIENGAENPVAHFRLAILYAKESRVDEALTHLEAAFEKDAAKFVPLVRSELRNVRSDLDQIRYKAEFNDLLSRYERILETK
jgi:superkiller protein 3